MLSCTLFLLDGCPSKTARIVPAPPTPAAAPMAPAVHHLPPPITAHTHTITSPRGYTLDLPDTWTSTFPKEGNIDLLAVCPATHHPANTFKSNMVVAVATMASAPSMDAFMQANLTGMQQQLPHFTVLQSSDFAYGKKVVYRWTTKKGVVLQNCAYFFLQGATGYCLTGTTTAKAFAAYAPQFDRVARSFYIAN